MYNLFHFQKPLLCYFSWHLQKCQVSSKLSKKSLQSLKKIWGKKKNKTCSCRIWLHLRKIQLLSEISAELRSAVSAALCSWQNGQNVFLPIHVLKLFLRDGKAFKLNRMCNSSSVLCFYPRAFQIGCVQGTSTRRRLGGIQITSWVASLHSNKSSTPNSFHSFRHIAIETHFTLFYPVIPSAQWLSDT